MATSPNPYDQFDEVNPYDQFDAPAASQQSQQTYSPVAQPDPNATYPVGSELGAMAQNALPAMGKFWTDRYLGLKQLFGTAAPGEAEEKRRIDAPLAAAPGGSLGQVAAAAPLALLPGANTWLGAGLLGAGVGATDPTISGESRGFNTGLGIAGGLLGKGAGDAVANWVTGRAAEPFMGWSKTTGNRAVASAVGSDASKLNQPAISEARTRLGGVFRAARSPDVQAPIGDQTQDALIRIPSGLDTPSAQAFAQNEQVKSLTSSLGGVKTAEQLGDISSKLGNSAHGLMTSKTGDRALGSALFKLQDHVDDLVGSTIRDPALAQSYAAARPQYRLLSTLESRPTLLNSSTGDVNLTALGKYLQRSDKPGYTRGGNTSEVYNAARWGQATGQGNGPPKLTLGSDLGFDWLKYWALRNPATRAAGGAASRALAPIAPALPPLSRTAGFGAPALGGLLANAEQ